MAKYGPFDSIKELYICALEHAIKYHDSFFDAHCGMPGVTNEKSLRKAMGEEIYDAWKGELKAFEKKYKELTK